MSTYAKANWLYYILIPVEFVLVGILVTASDIPPRIVAAVVSIGLILLALAYPRCPNCGKNPWYRKVSADKWYAVAEYMPLGALQKTCSRCGTNLTKDTR